MFCTHHFIRRESYVHLPYVWLARDESTVNVPHPLVYAGRIKGTCGPPFRSCGMGNGYVFPPVIRTRTMIRTCSLIVIRYTQPEVYSFPVHNSCSMNLDIQLYHPWFVPHNFLHDSHSNIHEESKLCCTLLNKIRFRSSLNESLRSPPVFSGPTPSPLLELQQLRCHSGSNLPRFQLGTICIMYSSHFFQKNVAVNMANCLAMMLR